MELSDGKMDGSPVQSSNQMLVDERQKDMLLMIPCDLFVEHILLKRIPVNVLLRVVGSSCKRQRQLVNEQWEKLFSRDFKHTSATMDDVAENIDWCRMYRDASELGELSWEGVTDVSVRRGNPSWPCGRWGHSLVVIDGGSAVVYGGESQDETCSDIQLLDTRTWQWQCIKCTGESPERRFGHSCVYYEGNVIILGGSKGAGYYDDLCCLDVKRWHWWRPNCRGTPPMKRSSHSMTVVGNKSYVFGGIGGDGTAQCLQDISILDMDKWEWSQPEVLGEKPDGRFVHRVVAIGEELLLFGGRTSMNVKFNDVHWFNTSTLTWRSDPVIGVPPEKRGGCTLVAVGNKAIMFCGRAEDDSCLFDGVHLLATFPHTPGRPSEWRARNVPPKLGSDSSGPSARGAHGFAVVGGTVVVFGGYGPVLDEGGGEEQSLDDLFVLRFLPRNLPEAG